MEVLPRLVPGTVFKTVEPHGNHVVGGFDSHAFPPFCRTVIRIQSCRSIPNAQDPPAACFSTVTVLPFLDQMQLQVEPPKVRLNLVVLVVSGLDRFAIVRQSRGLTTALMF